MFTTGTDRDVTIVVFTEKLVYETQIKLILLQFYGYGKNCLNSPFRNSDYETFLMILSRNFLKLDMKIVPLSKLNPMVESACLSSKPFRKDSFIIHNSL